MVDVEQVALADYEAFVASTPVVLIHFWATWQSPVRADTLRKRIEVALESFDAAIVRAGMFDCEQPLPMPPPKDIDRTVVPKIAPYKDGRATMVLAGLQPAEAIRDAVLRLTNTDSATA